MNIAGCGRPEADRGCACCGAPAESRRRGGAHGEASLLDLVVPREEATEACAVGLLGLDSVMTRTRGKSGCWARWMRQGWRPDLQGGVACRRGILGAGLGAGEACQGKGSRSEGPLEAQGSLELLADLPGKDPGCAWLLRPAHAATAGGEGLEAARGCCRTLWLLVKPWLCRLRPDQRGRERCWSLHEAELGQIRGARTGRDSGAGSECGSTNQGRGGLGCWRGKWGLGLGFGLRVRIKNRLGNI